MRTTFFYLISVLYLFNYVQSFDIPSLPNPFSRSLNPFSSNKQNSTSKPNSISNQSGNKPKNETQAIPSGKNETSNTSNSNGPCYPPLGCYERHYLEEGGLPTLGWFTPDSPDKLNITIIHFTSLASKGQKLRYNSTTVDNYIRGKRAYFIIHGWQSGFSFESWIDQMKDTILKINNGTNIFVIDWSTTASTPFYPGAAENTKVVGPAVGYFITNTLVRRYGLSCDEVVVLGHSLGGQAAGFVGKYTKTQGCSIGIIIGLDPAGPYFRSENDPKSRISPDDATYTETCHTNAAKLVLTGLGTTLRSGLVDFWPNGGSVQTGCDFKDAIGETIKKGIDTDAPSCSHVRAPLIYATYYDKLASCQLVAYQCKDYDSFKKGECGDCGANYERCRLLGLSRHYDPRMIPPPKSGEYFYVSTTADAPYCRHTYQVKVTTSPERISGTVIGNFYLNLVGKARDASNVKVEGPLTGLESNTTYTLLVEKDLPLEELQKVEMYFDESAVGGIVMIGRKVKVGVQKVEVNYMSHINPEIRKRYSGQFMTRGNELISTSKKSKSVFLLSSN